MDKKVWIAGASGLVGGMLLEKLIRQPNIKEIHSFGRKFLKVESHKINQHQVDFSTSSVPLSILPHGSPQVAICCLGTTIRKAGTPEKFSQIDWHAVISFAREAYKAGASQFVVVSALGADPQSKVFYNRVKGNMERDLQSIGFAGYLFSDLRYL